MKHQKSKYDARRKFAARTDARIGSIEWKVAKMLKLPEGCVSITLPSGKKARSDKTIRALLKDWDYS